MARQGSRTLAPRVRGHFLGSGVPRLRPLSYIGGLCIEAGIPVAVPLIDVGLGPRDNGSGALTFDTIQLTIQIGMDSSHRFKLNVLDSSATGKETV